MARSRTGEAISPGRRTAGARKKLREFVAAAKDRGAELNGIEGVWKVTKKSTTHKRLYPPVAERDAALTSTFETVKAYPDLIAGHVARFL